MMDAIPVGAKGSFTLLVAPQHLANQFKDAMLPPVLATPVMIMIMENAALDAVRPFLAPSESAVGTVITIRHLAATPVGHRVRAEAEVTKVEGPRIEFTVTASDETEEIGSGTHERMVGDPQRLAQRLAAKSRPPSRGLRAFSCPQPSSIFPSAASLCASVAASPLDFRQGNWRDRRQMNGRIGRCGRTGCARSGRQAVPSSMDGAASRAGFRRRSWPIWGGIPWSSTPSTASSTTR